jgi:hypothetical protein
MVADFLTCERSNHISALALLKDTGFFTDKLECRS